MRRVILLALLAVACRSASAEWVKVGVDGKDSTGAYVNTETVTKNKNGIIVWTILDFSQAQPADGEKYLSIKSQHEYDCKEKEVRILYTALHSGGMGNGKTIYSSSTPTLKKSVPPNSRMEDLWEYACGMK